MDWNEFIDASVDHIASGMVQPLSFFDKPAREAIYTRLQITPEDDRAAQVAKLGAWVTRNSNQLQQRETESYVRRLRKLPAAVEGAYTRTTNKLADRALEILKATSHSPQINSTHA